MRNARQSRRAKKSEGMDEGGNGQNFAVFFEGVAAF
jgi:hypothetical protein